MKRYLKSLSIILFIFAILTALKASDENRYPELDYITCSEFVSVHFDARDYQHLKSSNKQKDTYLNSKTDKCLHQKLSQFLISDDISFVNLLFFNSINPVKSVESGSLAESRNHKRAPPV